MSCCGSGPKPAPTHADVSTYYGQTLEGSSDLKTNACKISDGASVPAGIKKAKAMVHPELVKYFYGCGSPIPPALTGCSVLDLGCGSGVDVYTCSKLVGETGQVFGVDMTEIQLDRAKSQLDYHTKLFEYKKPNVVFHKSLIEDLKHLADCTIDVIISNCVINLAPNKLNVFKEIFRVLKEGGELYFSDVYADRRIPTKLQQDTTLWGECLSGAMYTEDFRRLMTQVGFMDSRVVSNARVEVQNPQIEKRVGTIRFYSRTIRAFKLKSLEDRCEDFGQVATYLGTVDDFPHAFFLDDHHTFVTGYPLPVCGNTAEMISKTRYQSYFKVTEKMEHRGLFSCGEGANVAPTTVGCC